VAATLRIGPRLTVGSPDWKRLTRQAILKLLSSVILIVHVDGDKAERMAPGLGAERVGNAAPLQDFLLVVSTEEKRPVTV